MQDEIAELLTLCTPHGPGLSICGTALAVEENQDVGQGKDLRVAASPLWSAGNVCCAIMSLQQSWLILK